MTDTQNNTLDFDSMSEDQLASYIDSGGATSEVVEAEKDQDNGVEQPSEQKEEVTEENQVEDDQQEEVYEEDVRFKGKERPDLISSIQNGSKKISRQNNEIYLLKNQLRTERESREAILNDIKSSKAIKEVDEVDDLLSGYDKNDINVINKLVKKQLDANNQLIIKQKKEDQERIESDNDSSWNRYSETLAILDPTSHERIKESLINEIQQKGNASTLYKKGWVQSFVKANLKDSGGSTSNSSNQSSNNKTNLVKRKSNAATINGGSNTSGGGSLKGKPEPSDPVEYLKWCKDNLGISI